MKITKEQWDKIKEINNIVKELDPVLKERLIDYELYELFKDDYLKISPFIRKEIAQQTSDLAASEIRQLSTGPKHEKNVPTFKEFFDEKKPSTGTETVAVFGFYLEHFENKLEFNERDISKAYFEARVRKPKVIGQALRDAKNFKGYLVEGSKRGTFRLSNVGENLIVHDLPRKVRKGAI
jgi:hypothetical protein